MSGRPISGFGGSAADTKVRLRVSWVAGSPVTLVTSA